MSYFIANSLTISKDFKTFRVKGGDNNLVPRSNSWTEWIGIDNLLDMLSSGSLQFGNSNKEKFLMLEALSVRFKNEFGGNWEDETDMYHSFRKEEIPSGLVNLNNEFIDTLKNEIKLVSKKDYKVMLSVEYVYRVSSRHAVMTSNEDSAKLFGKYQAKRIVKRFSQHIPKIIKL